MVVGGSRWWYVVGDDDSRWWWVVVGGDGMRWYILIKSNVYIYVYINIKYLFRYCLKGL